MKTIDLKKLIDSKGLDMKEVSEQLFPKNKYPNLAMNRILRGDGVLDADQISKLSLLTGVPISDLFSGENWKAISRGGTHEFIAGEFKAILDPETWVTKIFHKDSMFHESVIHSGATPVSEYLKELDLIINNFKTSKK